jgi:hypothetical protein
MILRRTLLPLMGVAALLAGLTFPAGSQADPRPKPKPPPAPATGKPKPPPPPPAKPKPPPAPSPAVVAAQVRLVQAQELRKAFVALAGANHTYHGHRAKAMHHVKEALTMLDRHVMTHGNGQQKAAIRQGRAAVAAAEKAAATAPVVHMPRRASDASLRQAGQVLRQVGPGLDLHKQHDVRGQVNHAIHHINVAPKVG